MTSELIKGCNQYPISEKNNIEIIITIAYVIALFRYK